MRVPTAAAAAPISHNPSPRSQHPSQRDVTRRYLGRCYDRDLLAERKDVGDGAEGRDGVGVDLGVAPGVVALDVQEVGRVPERRLVPVQVPQPRVQARVPRPDVAHVALEVLHVDGLSTRPVVLALFVFRLRLVTPQGEEG